MQLTQTHYDQIAHCFPKHRGSLTYGNLEVLNAILYIAENGAKWRRLPKEYDHWHTIYARMRGWPRQGVLARVFAAMQELQIVQIKVEVCSPDSTSVKMHPDGTGALKNGPQSIGRSWGGLATRIHLVAANERTTFCFSFSAGQAGDGPKAESSLRPRPGAEPAERPEDGGHGPCL